MDFKNDYPEYALIERQIRLARAERAAAIGTLFARAAVATWNGVKHVAQAISRGLEADRDRRAIEADSFLRRSLQQRY